MAPSKKRERSPSSTPIPSTEAAQDGGADLPEAEWEAMQKVLNFIYDYRGEDGFDPSKLFHRKVNKRLLPEYYDTIKEPMAMSTIKQKIHAKLYRSFADFVRDFALIPHNAQVFNRSDSGAFQDAIVIRDQVQKQLQLLVDEGVITKDVAELPDLGEIPTYEEAPLEEVEGEGEEEEESDEEGEDDEEEEPDLDDEGRPKKKRGRPPGSKTKKAPETAADDADGKRSRGRPPKLLTPTEARILAVLKGIRKPKNNKGQLMIRNFDRLPDKQAMPEYYAEVKQPIAYDVLKKKVKRKKYATLEAFMSDVNLMFNNAKEYNQDDSQIFKDAVALQVEAGKLYDAERGKPDDSFADEDGKIPMPNGILHNGELYKVGDWIHIQNPNDLTKPIPAQIYRTYKDPKGQNMVNVCWYYRPEQTVHRFDKHFLNNEVVKTGRYRDHRIDEVESKCFIMFYTRYFKGRPRNLPEGTEIYVCRDRYNEERHQFNTIKTWASCLPDEVRDKDYEMDLFDHTRPMKKHPSPIAYMLKDDQKESDDFPKVTWGADGAPPKIGAVHRRPRHEKDSPPPEPTPPPQPKVEPPAPRPVAQAAPNYQRTVLAAPQQSPRPANTGSGPSSFTPSHQSSYTPQSGPSPAAPRLSSTQASSYTPATPQTQTQPRPAQPSTTYQQQPSTGIPPNPAQYPQRPNTATNYRDPPPIEVYTLPDQANLSIPSEIREQYQRDEFGRVLFFTTPPISASQGATGTLTGHSVRYLAAKGRRAQQLAQKRQERDLQLQMDDRLAKKARLEADKQTETDLEALKKRAFGVLESQLADSIDGDLGDRELGRLSAAQKAAAEQMEAMALNDAKRAELRKVRLEGEGFADDWDNRML
jgi:chromatin structure-remodeling complex subunit RSC1/2